MSSPLNSAQFSTSVSESAQLRPIRWEKWTAIGTLLMALCALATAFWQGYQLQRYNKLSVKPLLQFEANLGHSDSNGQFSFEIMLINNGLGPAHVTEVAIWLGDKKLNSTSDIWPALGVELPQKCKGWGSLQRFYKVDDRQLVLRTNPGCVIDNAVYERIIKELKLAVVYESLYGERFHINI